MDHTSAWPVTHQHGEDVARGPVRVARVPVDPEEVRVILGENREQHVVGSHARAVGPQTGRQVKMMDAPVREEEVAVAALMRRAFDAIERPMDGGAQLRREVCTCFDPAYELVHRRLALGHAASGCHLR